MAVGTLAWTARYLPALACSRRLGCMDWAGAMKLCSASWPARGLTHSLEPARTNERAVLLAAVVSRDISLTAFWRSMEQHQHQHRQRQQQQQEAEEAEADERRTEEDEMAS